MAHLNIAEKLDVVVVSFNDARILDEATIGGIGQEFAKLTTEAAAERKLLLSFARVSFMSSAMLGKIMRLSKQAKADKIDLKLCDISPEIMEVFKITRLEKVLDIRKSEQGHSMPSVLPARVGSVANNRTRSQNPRPPGSRKTVGACPPLPDSFDSAPKTSPTGRR